jgi:NIMA (never in mitosis gene a)-related kinase
MDGFEILKKIGDGSYSVVYKVRRKADDNIYALKKVNLQKLKEKEKQNALNEVRILASIKSPFVISYKEAFIEESDKSLCIVMEYADKGDLYQKIVQFKKSGCLIEETDVWRIFIQMTRGLKALHDLQILHRDLKSANIFLFSDGSAKIGDCNVSKVVYKGMGTTQTGTPYYASPEVWNDEPYDNKSDIWSLGCITYEMLALHPPFRAQNMDGLYEKVTKGKYGKITNRYSSDLAEIVKFLLKVNPKDRPNCGQILKHPLVVKRIEFFKEQEGFKDDNFDDMDEGKLLKTLRITKNMLFLSEQLPNANYSSKDKMKFSNNNTSKSNTNKMNIKVNESDTNKNITKNELKEKNDEHDITHNTNITNNVNNVTIKTNKNNSSLPSIANNSHRIDFEDNKIANNESTKKIVNKYKIELKNGVNKINNNKLENKNNKRIIIKTDNILSIGNIYNINLSVKNNVGKDINHSIDHIVPSYKLYQPSKNLINKKENDVLKYLENISGNGMYNKYLKPVEINKYNNRNRINLYINHQIQKNNICLVFIKVKLITLLTNMDC